jgi:hypothetical protein
MSVSYDDLKRALKDVMREDTEQNRSGEPTADVILKHLRDCPDCFRDVMKDFMEHSELECETCHAPLGSEKLASQLTECPFCHGKKATKRQR